MIGCSRSHLIDIVRWLDDTGIANTVSSVPVWQCEQLRSVNSPLNRHPRYIVVVLNCYQQYSRLNVIYNKKDPKSHVIFDKEPLQISCARV